MLLVAMDRACPESGTSGGLGREGRVCSVIFWMLPLGAGGGKASWGLLGIQIGSNTLQMETGLGSCAPVTLTCPS